ncbi:hypothetical protein M408DRAFT_291871 [Serendipita vermifera MAFF 305830]|uniref:RRM domain-containing protein n=1 Tax=Serendipita vermifera MAFF 305830 TaxID=933852 RepID=A0A0C2W773_SERVB|nr:hypothetical protein M408DRAFT_291871 [Serendipita vermifera MAFF 305830]
MDNRGHGTIVYSSEEEAKKAVAHFNGFDLHGWILRVQIGKVEHQQQGSAQLVGDAKATAPRRRSGEYQTSANTLPTAPNPATVTAATEPTYSYPTYMTMAPTGYMVASQPGSPYDQYPPSMTYVPVTSSPVAAYPPSLNGGMYTYSTWHHQPPPGSPPNPAGDMSTTVSNGAGVVPKGPNTSSAALGGQNTAASSTTATSSTTRTAPGRITLPNPGMGMYPPAPVSPMHGRPPITPSMPSFSFVQQPMPTPPLHPQFLSPGLGPYSPVNASPGFYRPMNHYFNLAPGAPVHYHHDPNAMSNNGVIGSGANRHGMLGGFLPSGIMSGGSTPYFDMTAATAGSDAPQEYFPPMPITASLAGAVHSMNLSATSATNSAVGSSTGASSNDSSRLTTGQNSVEEDAPYLEPVGVGRDGFPSLSAKHSDKSVPSASRTGLTEWVTTPDDLPTSASGEVRALTSQRSSVTHDPALSVPTPVPTERPISADPSSISSSKKLASPTSTVLGTAGSTSPGSTGSGPIYSSSNKPKLNLGPIPRFQPSERMMNAYSAIANGINRTASGSGGGSGGGGVPGSASSMQKAKAADTPKSSKGSNGSGVTGGDKSSIENAEAAAASQGVSAAGALKVNGTSSGFRDSMSADAGAGGTRRASWTEDASKRQAILNALNGVYAHDGENVR